jgi:flagellar export protein FliJ
MKGLATLIRLHRLKLTDQQRRLAALQAVAQGFRAEIAALDRDTRAEAGGAAGDTETGYTLGAFVQASLVRRRVLEDSVAGVEREMAAMQEQVAAAFRALKRYELIEEQRQAEARLTQQRRARRVEDEIGMQMHRQKKQAAHG